MRRHTEQDAADRLVASRFFDAVATRFPAGQAYAAAEETALLVESGDYDRVFVDTPPVGGGIDFFESPGQISRLVAGRALRVLTGPVVKSCRYFIYSPAKVKKQEYYNSKRIAYGAPCHSLSGPYYYKK